MGNGTIFQFGVDHFEQWDNTKKKISFSNLSGIFLLKDIGNFASVNKQTLYYKLEGHGFDSR
jgi:hypothetical protein